MPVRTEHDTDYVNAGLDDRDYARSERGYTRHREPWCSVCLQTGHAPGCPETPDMDEDSDE